MGDSRIDYPTRLQAALRGLVRDLLQETAENGLPGDNHYYLAFDTTHPDVVMPEALRRQYPEEMSVVIQHQYWDLVAEEARFSVTLRFSGQPSRVTVPYEALVSFVDPVASFGLKFEGPEVASDVDDESSDPEEGASEAAPGTVLPFDRSRPGE